MREPALTSHESPVQRGELQTPHAMSQTSEDMVFGILSWVAREWRTDGRTYKTVQVSR
jgi:hypothetical protein